MQEKVDDAEQAKIRAEQNADALKTQSKVQNTSSYRICKRLPVLLDAFSHQEVYIGLMENM